jgi:hypothetical protein
MRPEELRQLNKWSTFICYPDQKWTHLYTDGSATEATRDGGGGILIKYKDKEEAIARSTLTTGRYSSNYRAEAVAIEYATIERFYQLARATRL